MRDPAIRYEHSGDGGSTWQEFEINDRSAVYVELRSKRELEVHRDGLGNLYRWRSR